MPGPDSEGGGSLGLARSAVDVVWGAPSCGHVALRSAWPHRTRDGVDGDADADIVPERPPAAPFHLRKEAGTRGGVTERAA